MHCNIWVFSFNNIISVTSQGPTIEKLQKISELGTLKVSISDVLTAKSDHYTGSWLIKGYAKIGVDVRNATLISKDSDKKILAVKLPKPKVITASIDHERTCTWDYKKVTWWPGWTLPDNEVDVMRDDAYKQAQKLIEKAASNDEHIQQAKELSEIVINNMYKMVDWTVQIYMG